MCTLCNTGTYSGSHGAFVASGCDDLQTVVRFLFPPQRAYLIQDGHLKYQYPEYKFYRSQDMEPGYHDCGQFSIRKSGLLTGVIKDTGNTCAMIIPEEYVQDVDTWSDWRLAEVKYRRFILGEE